MSWLFEMTWCGRWHNTGLLLCSSPCQGQSSPPSRPAGDCQTHFASKLLNKIAGHEGNIQSVQATPTWNFHPSQVGRHRTHLAKAHQPSEIKFRFFSGILSVLVCVDGLYRGLGDKYVVRMDELVSPLDRHIIHLDTSFILSSALLRRRVKRPERKSSRVTREADGGRNTLAESVRTVQSYQGLCGHQSRKYEPPLPSSYIRNGTCSPYGAFPWVVQIQVNKEKWSIIDLHRGDRASQF